MTIPRRRVVGRTSGEWTPNTPGTEMGTGTAPSAKSLRRRDSDVTACNAEIYL